MKCRLLTFCVAVITISVIGPQAGANDIQLDSKITAVTVYRDCARVTRTAKIDLTPGNYRLVFNEIPLLATEGSLRATVQSDGIRVLRLTFNTGTAKADSARIKKLSQTLAQNYNLRQKVLENRKSVLEKRQAMLERLATISPPSTGDDKATSTFDAQSWATAYSIVARDLATVVDSIHIIELEIAEVYDSNCIMEADLAKLRSEATRQFRRVTVDVQVMSPDKANVALDYMMPNATWSSSYNAYLLDSNRVEIGYFGQVVQQTGEDWNDIDLILSTAQPNRAATPGNLAARVLAAYDNPMQNFGQIHLRGGRGEPQVVVAERALLKDQTGGAGAADAANLIVDGFDHEYGRSTQYLAASAYSTDYSTQFVTARRETIPSGDQVARTPISVWTLKGTETLVARPQNQQHVFRFIKLVNTSGVPLLPGDVNLFAGADYVGQLGSPNLILPDQEFDLPFGIDDRIEVKREIHNRHQNIDSDRREIAETVSISFVNHSGFERKVSVEEALPTSSDNRVKVDIVSMSPKPGETGIDKIAKWEVNLLTGAKQTISVEYKIEYPATMTLSGI